MSSLTLGVLETAASGVAANASSSTLVGTKVSRRTENAKGLGAKSAQGLTGERDASDASTPDDSEERSDVDAALCDGIDVFCRQRGQRTTRPAKREATVNSERQESQTKVIFIEPISKTDAPPRKGRRRGEIKGNGENSELRRIPTAAREGMTTQNAPKSL